MTLVIPLLAIYAESLGATPLQATLLVSVFAVCMLLSGPLIGHASDRHGRKPMLLLSQVGTLYRLHRARARHVAVDGLPVAHHRWRHGRQPVDRAGVHRRQHPAGATGEGIRPDWHRLRHGILHRARADRFPRRALRPHGADLSCRGDVGDQHPVHRHAAQERRTRPVRRPRPLGRVQVADLRAVFRTARIPPAAGAVPVFHAVVLDVHFGLRAVCRAPIRMERAAVRAARRSATSSRSRDCWGSSSRVR